jgi:hypothetical protein
MPTHRKRAADHEIAGSGLFLVSMSSKGRPASGVMVRGAMQHALIT